MKVEALIKKLHPASNAKLYVQRGGAFCEIRCEDGKALVPDYLLHETVKCFEVIDNVLTIYY